MAIYKVLVRKDPNSDFGVDVPDLPGCVSAGASLSEALAEVREAIYCHLEGMAKDGELPPPPSELLVEEAEAAVEVELPEVSLETERFNITLPW